MKNKLLLSILLVAVGCINAVAQNRGNIIKYIDENKLYQRGNDVTVTKLDLEWPVALGGKGLGNLQSELCKDLLGIETTSMQDGWTQFHRNLGTEIKHMPDSVSRHYLYLTLQELWLEKGRYVSFYLKRQMIEADGSQSDGMKKLLTYDLVKDEIVTDEFVFPSYTDEYSRVAFESLLEDASVCADEDKPEIDLTQMPKDFAIGGAGIVFNLGGPVDHDDFSTISINNLYQIGFLRHAFVRWIQGKTKAKKNEASEIMPVDFDSSLSPDTVAYNITELPSYPGGNDSLIAFLRQNVNYPEFDMKMQNQGRVELSFIVEKDGSLSDITVTKPVSPSLDREAVRVIRIMPKWTPAKRNGQNVRTIMHLPVTYRIGG